MITIHFTWIGPFPSNAEMIQGITELSSINDDAFNIVWWVEQENMPHAQKFLRHHNHQHAVTLNCIESHHFYQTSDVAWALKCLKKYRAFSLCKDIWSFLVLTYHPGCNFHLDAGIEVERNLTMPFILTEASDTESKVSLMRISPKNVPSRFPRAFSSLRSLIFSLNISLRPYSVPFYAQMFMSNCFLPAKPMRSEILDVFAMKSYNPVEATNQESTSLPTNPEHSRFDCKPNPKFLKVLQSTLQTLKQDFDNEMPPWKRLLPYSCGRSLITQRNTRDRYIAEICIGQLVVFEQQRTNLEFLLHLSERSPQTLIPSLGIMKNSYHSWRNISSCNIFDILQFEMQNAQSLSRIILFSYVALQLSPQQRIPSYLSSYLYGYLNSMFISTILACPTHPIVQAIEHKTQANDRILNAITARAPVFRPSFRAAMNKQPWDKQPIHIISSAIISLSTGLLIRLSSKSVQRIASPSRQQACIALATLFASTLLKKCVLKASRIHHYSVFKKPTHASEHSLKRRNP